MRRTHRQISLIVASVAAASVIWPIAIFWFAFPPLSPAALHSNAMVLILLWGLAPAVWFTIEWRIWRSDPDIAQFQRIGRDFWLGAGVIVLITFTYRGNVSGVTTPAGSKTLVYDIGGNVSRTIVNGVSTNITTNSSTNWAAPYQITTNTLPPSTMNWNSALAISSAAGPNGDTASFGYDSNGRPLSTTSPTDAVTNYTYNDSASPALKTATTNGHWAQTAMDGFGRTIQTQTGYSATGVSVVATHDPCDCSPLGKVSQVSQPFAPNGSVYWTNYTYDASGRTTRVALPDGSHTDYLYQGNTVTATDPAGKSKTFTMDAFGNLTKVVETDPNGGGPGIPGPVTTNYTYDILNHLIRVNMPRGTTPPQPDRTFNYIPSGTNSPGAFLLSATNPENGTITYTYSNGMLASKTDAKGQVFTYFYDGYNRLDHINIGGVLLRTFIYDTNSLDGSFTSYGAGRLVAVKHPSFTPGSANPVQINEMFSYTIAGQPAKKRLQVNESLLTYPYPTCTVNLDAAYTYDNEGKMTSVNYPTTYPFVYPSLVPTPGPTYTYSFDSMSRPIGLTDQNSYAAVSGVQYGSANQLLSMYYFGVSESRTYNTLVQLTNIYIPGQLNLTYNYPTGTNNGKISSQTDAISGETVTYAYDSLNRLLSASGSGWSDIYGYDGFGNLVSKTPFGGAPQLSIAVDPATNQIRQVQNLSYDANGNELYGGVSYDAENRIASAPGVQYAYDSQNKRVWKGTFDGSGNLTSQEAYFYGVDGQKLGTYPLVFNTTSPVYFSSTNTNLAVFFGGKRVAVNGAAFGQDRLGSNGQGRFFPYGEDRGTPIANDQVKFATYTRDSATGLDYADQRYYSNQFARFMSPDPYRAMTGSVNNPDNPQSWNRYGYVGGDPVNRTDPRGNAWICLGPSDDLSCSYEADDQGDGGTGGGGGNSGSGGLRDDAGRLEAVADKRDSARVVARLGSLRRSLASDPKCLQFLESGSTGGNQALFDKFYGQLVGAGGQTPLAGASDFSGTAYDRLNAVVRDPNTGFLFTVNSSGAFFTTQKGVGYANQFASQVENIQPATPEAQYFILLHELAHYFTAQGYIQDDGTDLGAQKFNNDQIWKNCQKSIQSVPGGGII